VEDLQGATVPDEIGDFQHCGGGISWYLNMCRIQDRKCEKRGL